MFDCCRMYPIAYEKIIVRGLYDNARIIKRIIGDVTNLTESVIETKREIVRMTKMKLAPCVTYRTNKNNTEYLYHLGELTNYKTQLIWNASNEVLGWSFGLVTSPAIDTRSNARPKRVTKILINVNGNVGSPSFGRTRRGRHPLSVVGNTSRGGGGKTSIRLARTSRRTRGRGPPAMVSRGKNRAENIRTSGRAAEIRSRLGERTVVVAANDDRMEWISRGR